MLLAESLDLLAVRAGGVYVDGTLGAGGHALAMLERSAPDGVVLGIDRDPRSLYVARRRLSGYGRRAVLVHGAYAEMKAIAGERGIVAADGILLDLGFSSQQVDSTATAFRSSGMSRWICGTTPPAKRRRTSSTRPGNASWPT